MRFGANPDLRDEDGKTPLDKARERGDEGHHEVIQILQSPGGEWMIPVNQENLTRSAAEIVSADIGEAIAAVASTAVDEGGMTVPEATEEEKADQAPLVRGDPEMAPVFLRRLMPVFTHVFQSTMLQSVRKASLALLRKMVHYTGAEQLVEISGPPTDESVGVNHAAQLVDVLATVLDTEVIEIWSYNSLSKYFVFRKMSSFS